MRRRDFMTVLAGAAAYPLLAGAQQKAMPVIGFLNTASPGPLHRLLAAFRQGLSETGYVEGQNVAIEYRWAEGRYDRLPALAADLVGRKVDVIVASGGRLRHWRRKTRPRRSRSSSSPAATRSRTAWSPVSPGRAATSRASAFFTVELTPKRLELLSELVPQARVIALLVNPNNPMPSASIRDVQEAARAKGVQLHILKASTESEIDAAFATLVQLHAGALVVGTDPFFNSRREQLVALAARHAVPAIYEWREFAAAGGLISYGPSLTACLSPGRHLRRKDPQGRQARRSAGPAADQIRAGHQPQDRQGARPHRAAIAPRPRRRGDRMTNRHIWQLAGFSLITVMRQPLLVVS